MLVNTINKDELRRCETPAHIARRSGRNNSQRCCMRWLSIFAARTTMSAQQWHPAGPKPTRTALESLKARKEAFLGDAAGPLACWTCCLGSSAGDLDSLASALAAAHACNGTAVARFRREDLALRNDCVLALGPKGAEALVYVDELTAPVAAKRREKTTLVLVDHNRFDAQALDLGDRVICVMDHHKDEGFHKDAIDREVDETCGSCASLLAERMAAYMEPDLARILLAAIAVDCRGFDAEVRGKKFCARDVTAAHALIDALGATAADRSEESLRSRPLPGGVGGAASMPDLAAALNAARHDTTGFSAAQVVALDYKSAVAGNGLRVGAASILTPFDDFEARAGGSAALAALLHAEAAARNVDVLFAMCQTANDRRGLAYVSTAPATAVERGLETAPASLPSELRGAALFVAQDISGAGFGAQFSERAPGLRFSELRSQTSRKTVLPAILHFCASG